MWPAAAPPLRPTPLRPRRRPAAVDRDRARCRTTINTSFGPADSPAAHLRSPWARLTVLTAAGAGSCELKYGFLSHLCRRKSAGGSLTTSWGAGIIPGDQAVTGQPTEVCPVPIGHQFAIAALHRAAIATSRPMASGGIGRTCGPRGHPGRAGRPRMDLSGRVCKCKHRSGRLAA